MNCQCGKTAAGRVVILWKTVDGGFASQTLTARMACDDCAKKMTLGDEIVQQEITAIRASMNILGREVDDASLTLRLVRPEGEKP